MNYPNQSRSTRFLIVLCMACMVMLGGCKSEEPAQELPKYYDWGVFQNGSERHDFAFRIDEQKDHELKGRFKWDYHNANRSCYGNFTGYTAGDQVTINMEVPESWQEVHGETATGNFKLGEATPHEANQVRSVVKQTQQLHKDTPKDIKTRKIMTLSGNVAYKYVGKDRMAIGFVSDVKAGDAFKNDKGK